MSELNIPPESYFFKVEDGKILFKYISDMWESIEFLTQGHKDMGCNKSAEYWGRIIATCARDEWREIYYKIINKIIPSAKKVNECYNQIDLWSEWGGLDANFFEQAIKNWNTRTPDADLIADNKRLAEACKDVCDVFYKEVNKKYTDGIEHANEKIRSIMKCEQALQQHEKVINNG